MSDETLDEGNVLQAWNHKNEFIKKVQTILQEYIDEAEHQDGWQYWLSVLDEETFVSDFGRYLSSRESKD